ncbi:O-methyltransferase family 2 [Catenulispora acidiphila DSM 44928]|uniref:O-methyltransferase family 2 n=1 Tax=Catenulispora acidiphila (strain DSM 44928 / JCM 14897 / NBRC 102108 / NRRL B-24433 / ID139908) TaxID=479433 RepID=C7PXU9_CATAD|nr:methyltransferase [Catenulispora acidiphila]ACU73409.1 O-methyltransferase family 2 [Catenulispora acidiphila DSM 44928]
MTIANPPSPQFSPAPSSPQSAMRLRELIFGAACAAAVRAAASLEVADALGEEPMTVEDLAKAVHAEPGPLRRLLRTLTCYGVFTDAGEDRYAHTDMSWQLRKESPNSLHYIALWCTEPWTWQLWPHLDEAVRTGRNIFPDVYGKEFFTYLHEDATASAEVFDKAMTHSSRQSAADLVGFLNLEGITSVVDIGGGQGHVLASLLEKHPEIHGTLIDLPQVIARADPRLHEAGTLSPRARLIATDCRTEVPVQADLYIIKNILEWDTDSTRRTLRNVVEAAPPGARVVVVENLVDDTPSMRFTTAMDLLLLLNVGGAKHSRASLQTLLTEAGLRVDEVRPVNPYLHAFECVVPG